MVEEKDSDRKEKLKRAREKKEQDLRKMKNMKIIQNIAKSEQTNKPKVEDVEEKTVLVDAEKYCYNSFVEDMRLKLVTGVTFEDKRIKVKKGEKLNRKAIVAIHCAEHATGASLSKKESNYYYKQILNAFNEYANTSDHVFRDLAKQKVQNIIEEMFYSLYSRKEHLKQIPVKQKVNVKKDSQGRE